MSVSRVLLVKDRSGATELVAKPLPTPGPGEIVVKETAAGLNSVDWKILGFRNITLEYPTVFGNDGAGEVAAVGEGVTQFQVGDQVFHQGGLTSGPYATFQDYVLVPAEVVSKVPPNITLEQAASLSVGISTAVIALYSPSPVGVGLKAPWDGGRGQYAGQPALILGGATSVGQYAIQFAKLNGFSPIITTASSRNTDLLRSLGATHVIDRSASASEFASEIARITAEPIPLVYDTVGIPDTQQRGYDTLAEGGHIVSVLDLAIQETPGSTKKLIRVFGNVHVALHRAIGRALASNLTALLEAGDIVPNRIEIVPGGLHGVAPGLEMLKGGLVRGKKLVIRLEETASL